MRLVSIARFQIESAALRLEVKPGLFMDHKDFSSGYQEVDPRTMDLFL